MNELMVWLYRDGAAKLMKMLIYLWWAAKTIWQLHECRNGEIDGLGSKIGPKP